MGNLEMGFTTWGVKPWWRAVQWWWPRDRRRSIAVLIRSAIPAMWFSLRYGGWEAHKANSIEVSEQ